jgi:phosphotransferase system enzyme I (PtsP)
MAMVAELPVGELKVFLDDYLSSHAVDLPMRALLQAFADDRSIPL